MRDMLLAVLERCRLLRAGTEMKLTARPAALLGLNGGTLSIGANADFVVTDIDAPWVVDADNLRSKSQNAAIDKRKVQGQVLACYVGGKAVFEL